MGIALWYCPKKTSILYMELSNVMLSLQSLFPDSPDIHIPHITITSGLEEKDTRNILTSAVAAVKSITLKRDTSESVSLDNASMSTNSVTENENENESQQQQQQQSQPDNELLIKFTEISLGSTFFTRVKIDVDKNSNKVLLSLVKLVRDMYLPTNSVTNNELSSIDNGKYVIHEYAPHVSLVYSNRLPSRAEYLTVVTRLEDALDCEIDRSNGKLLNTSLSSQGSSSSWLSSSWDITNGTFMVVRCVGPIGDWKILGSVDL